MESSSEAQEAIRKFDGYSLDNRSLRVGMAKEREAGVRGFGPPFGERGYRDGVTGFVCHTLRDVVEAVERAPSLCRYVCRERALERFSAGAMADGYETIFHAMMANRNS